MSNNCIIVPVFQASTNWDTVAVGTFVEGGYFVGRFMLNGSKYALILSPAEAGSYDGAFGTPGAGNKALSLIDGLSNTREYNDSGHPLAQWALTVNINGNTDWYIPARDELEMIYRNLKPTTNSNATGTRIHQQVGDTQNTMGVNNFSVPTGAAYTAGNPTRTPLVDFQAGGSQAIPSTSTWLYSSTGYSGSTGVWSQNVQTGSQQSYGQGNAFHARLVRKVKIG